MARLVIDSWAWVEYLTGTETGEKIRAFILNEANELYTNPINLAEVVSLAGRKGLDPELAYNAITSNSTMVAIDEQFCKAAGLFHGDIRKTVKDFGLGDAFAVITARRLGAKVLTGDPHFRHIKEAIML